MSDSRSRRSRKRRSGNQFRFDYQMSADDIFAKEDDIPIPRVRPRWMKVVIFLMIVLAVALVLLTIYGLAQLSLQLPNYDNKSFDESLQ
jgi:hypothetical protein